MRPEFLQESMHERALPDSGSALNAYNHSVSRLGAPESVRQNGHLMLTPDKQAAGLRVQRSAVIKRSPKPAEHLPTRRSCLWIGLDQVPSKGLRGPWG